MVMVHGLGGSSGSFELLMPALGGFCALRPDLPGAGRSALRPAPGSRGSPGPFASACGRRASRAPTSFGHSMGALIVLIGGDYGFAWTPMGTNAKDFEYFVDLLGMSPMEAIQAGTRYGGEIMGMGNELGLVREGYLADLLLVDATRAWTCASSRTGAACSRS